MGLGQSFVKGTGNVVANVLTTVGKWAGVIALVGAVSWWAGNKAVDAAGEAIDDASDAIGGTTTEIVQNPEAAGAHLRAAQDKTVDWIGRAANGYLGDSTSGNPGQSFNSVGGAAGAQLAECEDRFPGPEDLEKLDDCLNNLAHN